MRFGLSHQHFRQQNGLLLSLNVPHFVSFSAQKRQQKQVTVSNARNVQFFIWLANPGSSFFFHSTLQMWGR